MICARRASDSLRPGRSALEKCGARLRGPRGKMPVLEECIRRHDPMVTPYFWRTSNGAELDLLLVRGDQRVGIEVKRADAPRITPSIRSALVDLKLDRVTVYYPGNRRYSLSEHVDVVPVAELAESRSDVVS